MKNSLVFLILVLAFCYCKNPTTQKKDIIQVNEFQTFVNHFEDRILPFCINNNRDFFPRMVFDSVRNGYSASKYQSIDTAFYGFLNVSKPMTNSEYDNRYGFKLLQNGDLTVLVTFKDSLWNDIYSMVNQVILNVYHDNEFVNSVVLAGSNSPINGVFGCIDNDLNLTIRTYMVKPSPKDVEDIFADETTDNYRISKDGDLLKVKSETKQGYFIFENGSYRLLKYN